MKQITHFLIILTFFVSNFSISNVCAGEMVVPIMPKPGTMVNLSPVYKPAFLNGVVIHPDNALQFDFLIHKGEGNLDEAEKNEEYTKLVKYFLASLTIPDSDQWVNLSPYENDRIIKDNFGKTEMGRDLLSQDYLLKQITSSLMYPENGLGKNFWNQVHERAYQEFGNVQVPVNTFNKVWIVPDEALVYESGNTAYVVKSHLKVMLEEDYLSLEKHSAISDVPNKAHTISSKMIKEIILPALEKEVNEGKNFAQLRQIYSGMILATWYKAALKESLLGKVYADKAKVVGVDLLSSPSASIGDPEKIYQQYLTAFKKGVYNYIKEDVDRYTKQIIPRKYFSGGFVQKVNEAMVVKKVSQANIAQMVNPQTDLAMIDLRPTSLDFNNLISFIKEPSKRGEGESGPILSVEKLDIIRRDLVPSFSQSQIRELSDTIKLSYPAREAERILNRLELPIVDEAMATPSSKGDVTINKNGEVEITKPVKLTEFSNERVKQAFDRLRTIDVQAREIPDALKPVIIGLESPFIQKINELSVIANNQTVSPIDPNTKKIALYKEIQSWATPDEIKALKSELVQLPNNVTFSPEALKVLERIGLDQAMLSKLRKAIERIRFGSLEKNSNSNPVNRKKTSSQEELEELNEIWRRYLQGPEGLSTQPQLNREITIIPKYDPTKPERKDLNPRFSAAEIPVNVEFWKTHESSIRAYEMPDPVAVNKNFLGLKVSMVISGSDGKTEVVQGIIAEVPYYQVQKLSKSHGYALTIKRISEMDSGVIYKTELIGAATIKHIFDEGGRILEERLDPIRAFLKGTILDPNHSSADGVWEQRNENDKVLVLKKGKNIRTAVTEIIEKQNMSPTNEAKLMAIVERLAPRTIWHEGKGFVISVKDLEPQPAVKNKSSLTSTRNPYKGDVEDVIEIADPRNLKIPNVSKLEPLMPNLPLWNDKTRYKVIARNQVYINVSYKGETDQEFNFIDSNGQKLNIGKERVLDVIDPTTNSSIWSRKNDMSKSPNSAMSADRKGGIDLDAANLNFQIKRDGQGVPLPISQQDMNMLQKIQGFVPRIIEIRPVTTLPMFSHLEDTKPLVLSSSS